MENGSVEKSNADFQAAFAPRIRLDPPGNVTKINKSTWLSRVQYLSRNLRRAQEGMRAVTAENQCVVTHEPGRNETLANVVCDDEDNVSVLFRGGAVFTRKEAEMLRDWLADIFPKGSEAAR
jgi:hypothetical protein